MIHIWSAIYGGYDNPKPLELDSWDFSAVLWTDQYFDNPDTDWELRCDLPYGIESPMLRAKAFKTLVPSRDLKDGDIFIWLDGSITVTEPNLIAKCLQALGDDDASFMRHPCRNCLYDEAEYSLQFPRYQNCGIESRITWAKAYLMPRNWGLIATGFFVIRIVDWTRRLLKKWWHECVQCHQDQISLPFLLWESKQTKWNYNLPWEKWFTRSEHLK